MQTNSILPVPEKFTVTDNFGELIIEYPWSRIAGIVMGIFSILWFGMFAFIFNKMPVEFRIFMIFHFAVGIYILYYAICSLVNKTRITCTTDMLAINSGPIPAFNNKKIQAGDIDQLYFTEKISRGKNNSETYSYQLHMLDKNQRSKRLIKNLPDPESARFIEQKLEKFYKIKNLAVAGQYDK